MTLVHVQKEDGIAVISLSNEPVNIMHLKFWRDLLATFEALEADASIRGVIFQSGLKRSVFTAGLDINEFYAPGSSREQLHRYWGTLSKTLHRVYSSPMMTASAIKGQCPAGGCALALCCDLRLGAADVTMGFNEVALGMGGIPPFWGQLMAGIIGQRHTERLCTTGGMPKSDELSRLGMLDVVVDRVEDVLSTALEMVRGILTNPNDLGRATAKDVLRCDFAKRWSEGLDYEVDFLWNSISHPQVVTGVRKTLDMLAKPAKHNVPPKAKL